MRLSCNDFKIRKLVKWNCKTLCICYFLSIYEVLFYYILYNLSFIKTTLEKIPDSIHQSPYCGSGGKRGVYLNATQV